MQQKTKNNTQAEEEPIEITLNNKFKFQSSTLSALHLYIHHTTPINSPINYMRDLFSCKKISSLKLVIYDCPKVDIKELIKSLNFEKMSNLKHLKLNFGCMDFSGDALQDLSEKMKGLRLETFHLSLPNTGLSEKDVLKIDENFIDYSCVKNLGFNFLKALKKKNKEEKAQLNLENFPSIFKKCSNQLENFNLNLSQNELKNVEQLQIGLSSLCEAKSISLKLIMYNCLLKQKMILMICDTLLKFENLKSVKLDIRENYDVKKEYPSCKVISFCETLICAFRQMLAEGDDNEANRKYKVCY